MTDHPLVDIGAVEIELAAAVTQRDRIQVELDEADRLVHRYMTLLQIATDLYGSGSDQTEPKQSYTTWQAKVRERGDGVAHARLPMPTATPSPSAELSEPSALRRRWQPAPTEAEQAAGLAIAVDRALKASAVLHAKSIPNPDLPLAEARSTREAVIDTLTRSPGREWGVKELADEMHQLGWTTKSTNPLNVLRTVLSRLAKESKGIVRTGRGEYTFEEVQADEDDFDPEVLSPPGDASAGVSQTTS